MLSPQPRQAPATMDQRSALEFRPGGHRQHRHLWLAVHDVGPCSMWVSASPGIQPIMHLPILGNPSWEIHVTLPAPSGFPQTAVFGVLLDYLAGGGVNVRFFFKLETLMTCKANWEKVLCTIFSYFFITKGSSSDFTNLRGYGSWCHCCTLRLCGSAHSSWWTGRFVVHSMSTYHADDFLGLGCPWRQLAIGQSLQLVFDPLLPPPPPTYILFRDMRSVVGT